MKRGVALATTLLGLCLTLAYADEGFYTSVFGIDVQSPHEGMVECWQMELQGLNPVMWGDCWHTSESVLHWWREAPDDSLRIPDNYYYTFLAWWVNPAGLVPETLFSDYYPAQWQWYNRDTMPGPWYCPLLLRYNTTRPTPPPRP